MRLTQILQNISWFSPSLSFKFAPGSQGIVIAARSRITSVDRSMAWNIKILESLLKTHCVVGAFQLWQQPLLSWPMISSCVLTSHLISHPVLVYRLFGSETAIRWSYIMSVSFRPCVLVAADFQSVHTVSVCLNLYQLL